MKQTDQTPDTRKRLDQFLSEAVILSDVAVIDMVGTNNNQFYSWRKGCTNSYIESRIKIFLAEDGSKFLEITKALKTAKKDRVALHQQRAAILQKARIHVPSKHGVPSLNNSTI